MQYISNFDSLFNLINAEMKIATSNNVILCEDAFFFGVNLNKSSIETYCIADFDNIGKRRISKKENKLNELIMLGALWEFNLVFIKNNENKKVYEDQINKRISEIQKSA